MKNILILLTLLATGSCVHKDSITIYTVGDSTMASYSPDRYPLTGWAQVLQQFFDEKSAIVKNHASSGRSTKSFISEGRWQAVLDSLKPGDYVLIQFGHNDQKMDSPERYAAPWEEYKSNLERMVNETRSKKATAVLLSSIARRKFGENGILVPTLGEYPDVVKEVSRSMKVHFIDMHQLTTDLVNHLGDEPSKEIYLWTPPDEKFPNGRKDDTHLSEKGAMEFAKLAISGITNLKCALKKHIKKKI
jgi:lysophospholipase L1-like esterase